MAAANAASMVTGLLGQSVETIEIRSRFSPPVVLRVKDLLSQQEGPPHPAMSILKPTVILRGGALGTQVIAPGGQASVDEWKWWSVLTATLAVVGAVTVLGVAFKAGRRLG